MNSQKEKEGSGTVRAAIITGIFALLAACVGGFFLLLNTMVNNGVIVFGASNPSNSNPPPTATSYQSNVQVEPIPTNTSPSLIIAIPTTNVVDTPQPSGLHICGEPAFNGNLQTADPLFLRPDGYLSGWISSDPSTIILPDGTTKVFETQYVLIVDNLSFVQVKGVQRQAGKAFTTGCWYSADLSNYVAEDAKVDFCKKKAGNSFAVLYSVSKSGFQEIGSTTTISCP